jgi:hypothetical protein
LESVRRLEAYLCVSELNMIDGEFSSILASPLRVVLSLDYPIRPRQHIWRNGQTDLFRRLEIDHQLEFPSLLESHAMSLNAWNADAATVKLAARHK